MTRPTVTAYTDLAYDRLPEVYRAADEADGDYPLLRYLSLITDPLEAVDALVRSFIYTPVDERETTVPVGTVTQLTSAPAGSGTYASGTYGGSVYGGPTDGYDTAALVDPDAADSRWLPWLAQLVGVRLPATATDAELRAAIRNPGQTWEHGTPGAITAAGRSALTGTRYLRTIPSYGGDPFTIGIVTVREETPSAGTWAKLKVSLPTWAGLRRAGSWGAAAAPAVLNAVASERPAGFKFAQVYTDQL
jgi:hypothetical protein